MALGWDRKADIDVRLGEATEQLQVLLQESPVDQQAVDNVRWSIDYHLDKRNQAQS